MTTKREEWTITLGPNGWRFVDASGDTVADDVSDELKPRIAAVPDYEAALLALLPQKMTMAHDYDRHTEACWSQIDGTPCLPSCELARAALRKGGRL